MPSPDNGVPTTMNEQPAVNREKPSVEELHARIGDQWLPVPAAAALIGISKEHLHRVVRAEGYRAQGRAREVLKRTRTGPRFCLVLDPLLVRELAARHAQPAANAPRLTEDEKQEIIRRYGQGEPTKELAAAFDVARIAIYKVLERRGVKCTQVGRINKLTEEERASLVAAYAGGATSTELSRQFGIAPETVIRTVRRRGVAVRRQGAKPKEVPGER